MKAYVAYDLKREEILYYFIRENKENVVESIKRASNGKIPEYVAVREIEIIFAPS